MARLGHTRRRVTSYYNPASYGYRRVEHLYYFWYQANEAECKEAKRRNYLQTKDLPSVRDHKGVLLKGLYRVSPKIEDLPEEALHAFWRYVKIEMPWTGRVVVPASVHGPQIYSNPVYVFQNEEDAAMMQLKWG